jgi:hypothetical protein
MSYETQIEDFNSVGIQAGHKQGALNDAWADFSGIGGYAARGPYDGPMVNFFKERKVTASFRYHDYAPAADNPEHACLFSLKAQGEHVREFGEAATRELLASQGLKLGMIKKVEKDDPDDSANNPYDDNFLKSHTPAQREDRIKSLIKSNATLATRLAKKGGKTVTGQPLQKVGAARYQK